MQVWRQRTPRNGARALCVRPQLPAMLLSRAQGGARERGAPDVAEAVDRPLRERRVPQARGLQPLCPLRWPAIRAGRDADLPLRPRPSPGKGDAEPGAMPRGRELLERPRTCCVQSATARRESRQGRSRSAGVVGSAGDLRRAKSVRCQNTWQVNRMVRMVVVWRGGWWLSRLSWLNGTTIRI